MKIKRSMLVILLLSFLVSGCGNRGIPVIKQELMEKKLSVLMLSSVNLSDPSKQAIGSALQKWRDVNFIAYDWINDLGALDDRVLTKLKTSSYDYIYVIGNDLFPSANGVIQQGLNTGKWTLLQSQLDVNGTASTAVDQAAFLQIDAQQIESLKTKWIQDLLAQNVTVEWVTRSDRPIPSELAPSEEADHIVLLDNNEQWFQQLSFQTRQHFAKWIIFYSPATEAQLQKAKTIGVSVMDISNSLSAELNWPQILDDRLLAMTSKSWHKGPINYNSTELTELKMK
ncbi:hypothetical protein [Paenibacillus planticolens]|uniref:Uncharacterized protein n=1 Tax=Paenibacillus planticolens TaxID=2654976 RepID=A0ABX1ZSR5_9BACL|nr:hypothetical protein [Paenibacillus planticolens]NOV03100.1 hypothetical protein [Paenibacillus planticolens]